MLKRFLPILLLMFTGFSYAQWFPQTSGVTSDLNSIFFLNDGNGFIVGNAGTFLKSTDSGVNWTSMPINTLDDFNDVYFINENEGIIVGSNGIILRTTDGGIDWDTINSGVFDNLYSVSFSGLNGIIGGTSQTILYSTDGGVSWEISQEGFSGGGFLGAFMLNSTTGFVAGSNSIFQPFVGKSTDGGATWDFNFFYFDSNEGVCTDVFFFDENNGLVTGSVWDGQGAISRTTNGGVEWTTQLYPNELLGINFPTNDVGFAVGSNGIILRSSNGGLSWPSQSSGTSVILRDIAFTGGALNGNTVGEGGTLLGTDNGGLPVELSSFTSNLVYNKVYLNWETATEINNSGFNVERKTGDDWTTLSFVEGSGTTAERKLYSYTDDLNNLNYSGKVYYRLKQIDYDGSYEYSFVIEVDYNSLPKEFSLSQNYPNPFNPTTTIRFSVPTEEFVTIKIYDIVGRELLDLVNEKMLPGNHEILFDASKLSSGVYFYKMVAGNFSNTKQFMILK